MVIAPSDSLRVDSQVRILAQGSLEKEFGLEVAYGKNTLGVDIFDLDSIKLRLEDFHNALRDESIKAIVCASGGYNANDLLPLVDWEILKKNPKPIIGSSDNTVLLNTIFAKTGIVTYFGPNFYKFGMKIGLEYTLDYFKKCILTNEPYEILPSEKWSDDNWRKDQDNREFHKNNGYKIYQAGSCEGTIIGGNLCSLNLLQGTEFMPDLKDAVLFIEDDDLTGEMSFREFRRNLQSLLQLPSAKSIKGIVVGRFQQKSLITDEKMNFIFNTLALVKKIPIIFNVDFGHTDPTSTFPIGGTVEINANNLRCEIKIKSH